MDNTPQMNEAKTEQEKAVKNTTSLFGEKTQQHYTAAAAAESGYKVQLDNIMVLVNDTKEKQAQLEQKLDRLEPKNGRFAVPNACQQPSQIS